jgi:lysophospholipase L1-like esterase
VKIWRTWCEHNQCRAFVNHFPDFFVERGRGDWRKSLYIENDTHFTPAGHRLIARLLSTELRQIAADRK